MNKKFPRALIALSIVFVLCCNHILPALAAYPKGDVNNDGTITTVDYFRIKLHFKGTYELTEEEFEAADINEDGKISTFDYIRVKKAIQDGLTSLNTPTPAPSPTPGPTPDPDDKDAVIKYVYENTEAKEVKLAIWGPPNPETYTTDANIDKLDYLCQKYVDLGITHIYNEGEWGSVTLNRIMDCYEKYGLKAIIGIPNHDHEWALRYVQSTMNHPACWGFNIKDEPATSQLADLTNLTNQIKAVLPEDKKVTINLLPNAAFTDGDLSNVSLSAYDTHVRQFLNGIKPDTLSFDSYPLTTNATITSLEMVYYLRNLLEINTQCRDAGVEATSIIQSSFWSGQRLPTATELEFLANLNLVSGMDGITYYLFYSHPGSTGLINASWGNNRLYATARSINNGISNMKGVFRDYDQVGYIFTNTPSAYRRFYNGVADSSVLKTSYGPVSSVSSGSAILSGCFTDDAGNKALYVMNFNMTAGSESSVKLNFSKETPYRVWTYDGLVDLDSGTSLTLNLAPGEAAFVEFK